MADPFQELGITRRPLFQMFGLPEDRGASSPRMAQAVRNDLITQAAQMKLDQDIADIERRGQAEAAADEFVRQNPDAAMAGSARYGDIARYQQMQMRGPSYSDAVLSRSLANRLQPSAREKFYQYVNEGRGVNQAYDDAEADEEDMKLRIGLVEAGVPEDALPPLGERIDPIRAAALRAAKKGSSGRDNLDDMNMYAKRLEDDLEGMKVMGLEPDEQSPNFAAYAAKRDELKQINQMRDEVLRNRFLKPVKTGTQKQIVNNVAAGLTAAGGMTAGLTPAGSVAAGIMSGTANAAGVDLRPTGAAPPPPIEGPAAIPASVSYDQIPAYLKQIEEQKAKVGEEAAIAEQWTQQKNALQKRLESSFPNVKIPGTNTTRLEAIARAVLNGDPVEDGVDAEGSPVVVPADVYALNKIGLPPVREAFAEVGNRRTGPQGVSNRELVKAWAEEFVNQRGLIDKEPTAGALTPEVRQKARAKVLEQIDNR
jgi:hypothetical protein